MYVKVVTFLGHSVESEQQSLMHRNSSSLRTGQFSTYVNASSNLLRVGKFSMITQHVDCILLRLTLSDMAASSLNDNYIELLHFARPTCQARRCALRVRFRNAELPSQDVIKYDASQYSTKTV